MGQETAFGENEASAIDKHRHVQDCLSHSIILSQAWLVSFWGHRTRSLLKAGQRTQSVTNSVGRVGALVCSSVRIDSMVGVSNN